MITATPKPSLDALASELTEMATEIATAHARSVKLAATGDPLRWRVAGLVWPLFASDPPKAGRNRKGRD